MYGAFTAQTWSVLGSSRNNLDSGSDLPVTLNVNADDWCLRFLVVHSLPLHGFCGTDKECDRAADQKNGPY